MMIGKMDALPADIILPHGMLPMDSSTIIPVTSQTRMLAPRTQSVTIMELGKRLLQSAKEGNADEVKELMSKGAPFSTDWLGTSPLHLAAMGNHLKTCQILLRAGISKDARTKVERTPLHISAYEGHKDIVQLLLSNGADVNVKDMLKMTPLHWAVQNEHNECIRLLLMHGAQTEVVNKFDKTPMSMALEQKRMDIVEMLHEAQQMEFEREQNVELEQATLVAASQCMAEDINVSPMKNDKSERYDNNLEPPDPMENIRILEDNQNEDEDIITHENSDENVMAENVLSEHEHEDPMQMFNTSSISISNESLETNVKKMPNILSDTKKFSTKNLTPYKIKGSKVFTLSTDQFLALTGKMPNLLKKVIPLNQNNTSTKPLKRIVMTKDKIMVTPKLMTQNFVKIDTIDTVMDQLTEAKKVANDLREKLRQKEQEIDRYEKLLHKLQALKK